ncbi:SHOCT domain-containing protein [Halostagnicola kamekurae]|uniref:Short C-terminal domain-containing protein n=1 Tax=Halostagnicola kamekurae TaxID=619731 RepID=A0A1I6RVJ4_9EURY|nr:SHOCT domain-containing protein [Halostagnicola kamekurae]SFS68755.1 Short C-terminal domain-containing protein [Halostagnicola kamekurae]
MSEDPATRVRENITGITTLLITGLWLALMFLGVDNGLWLAVLLVGYVVVIPIVALVFGDETDREEWWGDGSWGEESDTSTDTETESDSRSDPTTTPESNNREALETLRSRYAAGELTDEQFERKLERLLETETIEDIEQRRGSGDNSGRKDPSTNGPPTNRDVEYETE